MREKRKKDKPNVLDGSNKGTTHKGYKFPLIAPGTKEDATINTKRDGIALYGLFTDVIGEAVFITEKHRKTIIDKWQDVKPLTKRKTLQEYLYRMERNYWASIPPWERTALVNKITQEHEELKTLIMDDQEIPLLEKSRTVNALNQTTVKVNNLQEAPPPINILITTNIKSDELIQEANIIEDDN